MWPSHPKCKAIRLLPPNTKIKFTNYPSSYKLFFITMRFSNYRIKKYFVCPEFIPKIQLVSILRRPSPGIRTIILHLTVLDGYLMEPTHFGKLGINKILQGKCGKYKLPLSWTNSKSGRCRIRKIFYCDNTMQTMQNQITTQDFILKEESTHQQGNQCCHWWI